MDEIEYKLHSGDPVLASHAISKLLVRIKERHGNEIDVSNVQEYKLLLSGCDSDDSVLCASTCHALVLLAEHGITPVSSAIRNITSHLSSVKHYSSVVTAVSQLLSLELKSNDATGNFAHSYHLDYRQHPFVTILIHNGHCWRDILDHIKLTLDDRDISNGKYAFEFFRPVFTYIMCNPWNSLDDCKGQTWRILNDPRYMSQFQLDVLVWFRTNDAKACDETNRRVLELAESCLQNEQNEICAALVPLIASLAIRLLEYGCNPRSNFEAMLKLTKHCDDGVGNITLNLMIEAIAVCPAIRLPEALEVCNLLVDTTDPGTSTTHALLACLSKWMAYPCLLSFSSLETMKKLARKATKRAKTRGRTTNNRTLDSIRHADSYVEFYSEMNRNVDAWNGESPDLAWLDNMSLAPMDVKYRCRFILSGQFLASDDPKVTTVAAGILAQIAREARSFGPTTLCLVLHKLTTSRRPKELAALLSAVLPKVSVSKGNMPIVIHTLDTFYKSGRDALKLLSIELYAKTVEEDPRCYRFLSGALARTIQTDGTWLSKVTCAKIIRDICRSRPEHGEDLVPMISQILNQCSGLNGSAATAFAIEGISALCKAGVIDICSTWGVLAPMLTTETRPIVQMAVCKLLGEIPSFPVQNSEDQETLTANVVEKLWSLVHSSDDTRVIRRALDALGSYRFDTTPLSVVPREWRINDASSGKSFESEWERGSTGANSGGPTYVPGIYWIETLRRVNASVLSSAGNMLMSFVEQELKGFRSRMYNWPQGEPHNFKYLPERSAIRAIGEHLRRYDGSSASDERITLECLRIFARKYSKPLPNVRWDFLKRLSAISRDSEEYCLSIASENAATSNSAKRFVEEHVSIHGKESQLDSIRSRGSEESSVQISSNGEVTSDLFAAATSSYAKALREIGTEDEANREDIFSNLERLLDKIDLKGEEDSRCIAAALQLSTKDFDRLTAPSEWSISTNRMLRNAVILRTEVTLQKTTDAPLWTLKELVDAVSRRPELYECLLESVEKIQSKIHWRDAAADWTLDFIAHIQDSTNTDEWKKDGKKNSFYQDISLTSIISLSGVDKLTTMTTTTTTTENRNRSTDASATTRCRLLPLAIRILAGRQTWKKKISQVMEWLNSARSYDTPETYKKAFYNSLIALKDEAPYTKKWTTHLQEVKGIRERNI